MKILEHFNVIAEDLQNTVESARYLVHKVSLKPKKLYWSIESKITNIKSKLPNKRLEVESSNSTVEVDNNIKKATSVPKKEESAIDFKTVDIFDYLSVYLSPDEINDAERSMIFNIVMGLDENSEPILREKLEKIENLSPQFRFKTLLEILTEIDENSKIVTDNMKKGYYSKIENLYKKTLKEYIDKIGIVPTSEEFKSKFDSLLDEFSMEEAFEIIKNDLLDFQKQCKKSYTDNQYNYIESLKKEIKDIHSKFSDDKEFIEEVIISVVSKYKDLDGQERFSKTKEDLKNILAKVKVAESKYEKIQDYNNRIESRHNELSTKYPNLKMYSVEKYVEAFNGLCKNVDEDKVLESIMKEFDKLEQKAQKTIKKSVSEKAKNSKKEDVKQPKSLDKISEKRNKYIEKYKEIEEEIVNEESVNRELINSIKLGCDSLEDGLECCTDEALIKVFSDSCTKLNYLYKERELYKLKISQASALVLRTKKEIREHEELVQEMNEEKEFNKRQREYEIKYFQAEKEKLDAQRQKRELEKMTKQKVAANIDSIRKRKIEKERLARKIENSNKDIPTLEEFFNEYMESKKTEIFTEALKAYQNKYSARHM